MADVLQRGQDIADQANRLSDAEIVADLSRLLGPKLVAYLGGVSETRAVREWIEGTRGIGSVDALQKLRTAYLAARLIADNESAAIAQAWFRGLNPALDDVSPARYLRDASADDVGKEILGAARQFVSNG